MDAVIAAQTVTPTSTPTRAAPVRADPDRAEAGLASP